MKYFVRVGETELERVARGRRGARRRYHDRARDSPTSRARRCACSPIGDEVHRIVVRRGPRADGTRSGSTASVTRSRRSTSACAPSASWRGATAGPAGPAPLVAPMPGMIVRVQRPGRRPRPAGAGARRDGSDEDGERAARHRRRDGEGRAGAARHRGGEGRAPRRARVASRVLGFRPGAIASRPKRARTASTAARARDPLCLQRSGRLLEQRELYAVRLGEVGSATPSSRAGTRRARRSFASSWRATAKSARSEASASSTVRLA